MIYVEFDILLYAGKWKRRKNSLRENILAALRSTYPDEPDSVKIEALDGDPRIMVHVAISNEDCDAEAIVDLLHAAILRRLRPQYESQVESEITCIRED